MGDINYQVTENGSVIEDQWEVVISLDLFLSLSRCVLNEYLSVRELVCVFLQCFQLFVESKAQMKTK